jgi:hypothetical protein
MGSSTPGPRCYPASPHILWLALTVACAHDELPPRGMARLVLKCCELTEPDQRGLEKCLRPLDNAKVTIDGAPAGSCASWGSRGRTLTARWHVIVVGVDSDAPIPEGECCSRWHRSLELREGEARTETVGLELVQPIWTD